MAGRARNYRPSDIKKLFAYSGNRCAKPGCQSPMISEDGSTVLGEIAHIAAASSDGPRYDASMTDDDRRSLDNLILLCEAHHKQIDTNAEKYPTSLLKEWKLTHENAARPEEFEVSDAVVRKAISKAEGVRTNTYVIIGLLVLVLAVLSYLVINPDILSTSFDQKVVVKAMEGPNEVKLENGTVLLDYGNGPISSDIDRQGVARFEDISSEFKGEEATIVFEHPQPYEAVSKDMKYELGLSVHTLTVKLKGLDKISGQVFGDVAGTQPFPLEGVVVSVPGANTFTANDGRFELHIPLEFQQKFIDIVFTKDGYTTKKVSKYAPHTNKAVEMLLQKNN